jgi:nitrate/nitrite-specific signal transduction histidine kinase
MKAKLNLNSLRKRVLLSIVIFIVFFALITSFIIVLVIDFQMAGRARTDKSAAIESLSLSLQPLLSAQGYQRVNQVVTSALVFDNIAFVAVYDKSGALIDSETKQGLNAADFQSESHDVTAGGETIGRFEIGFSQKYIDDLIKWTTLILIIAVVGFLVLAGLALFIFMGRSVIQPIESIARTIRKIGPDNLSARTDVRSVDEIGILATNINQMADDLEGSYLALQTARDELEEKVELRTRGERRRSEQLRAINGVSRRISAILSLDELLPYVVHSVQETFNYYSVNIFLFDSEVEGVVLKAGRGGYKGAAPQAFLVRLNEGIIGKVARTGESTNAGDINQKSEDPLHKELMDTKSELAISIKIGDETIGVLDIRSIEADAFDEIDLFTAQTLGDQLAIAIENARLYRESRDIAVLEERNRMAREIHDTLAQGFAGVILQLEAAEQALPENAGDAEKHLDQARRLAKESLNEARRSVWALRPQALEQLPFTQAMRQQAEEFSLDTGIEVNLGKPQNQRDLPPEIENALLRIFQEALTNVKKHAQAARVEVNLMFDEKSVKLMIEDNGIGFDQESVLGNHFGLISMRERAKLLGGLMEIRSEADKGTQLLVIIPIERGTP